jgi:phosphopantothenoylcysteine decarboxylase
MKILLGLTGSVASTLYEKLITELKKVGEVRVVLTSCSQAFVDRSVYELYPPVYQDWQEWHWKETDPDVSWTSTRTDWRKDDPILHIDLRDWADVLVIAPCSANTLAKLANGLADNLLSCVARAWDFKKRMIIAPAMNTHMWEHPITKEHIEKLTEWGALFVQPQSKMLACKTEGMGALANISDIVDIVKYKNKWFFPLGDSSLPWFNYCPGIPVEGHPGAFLTKREHHTHTGVDLYTKDGQTVYAVEDGVIVGMEPFTGAIDNSPWWEDTWCILVEGESGVVCYGELHKDHDVRHIGDKVKQGCSIGNVKKVLKRDKPKEGVRGHSTSMLHIEIYKHGIKRAFEEQGDNKSDWNDLIDPTPYLLHALHAPTEQLK